VVDIFFGEDVRAFPRIASSEQQKESRGGIGSCAFGRRRRRERDGDVTGFAGRGELPGFSSADR